jgi:RNA polymerase-binding transcription factor DksA
VCCGYEEECGKTIEPKRLALNPFVSRCKSCQEEKDRVDAERRARNHRKPERKR